MKTYYPIPVLFTLFILCGCDDFLYRVPENEYVLNNFFESDEQVEMAATSLYSSVWFNYQGAFIPIGDKLAGNVYHGENPFVYFTVDATNQSVVSASYALWSAVAYSNSVVDNIRKYAGANTSEAMRNKATGEAIVWKAMAYFYLVRIWGAVPIVNDNTQMITSGTYKDVPRVVPEDVYEYIVGLLLKAEKLLPETNSPGRINRVSAQALLAKVYLTRSGVGRSGDRNQDDLDKAREYAGKVINESGLKLTENYADLFTISKGNRNPENLISWHWVVSDQWGSANAIQADQAVQHLTGTGDGWGTWCGPSIDLQGLFGEDATKTGAGWRVNTDKRRKCTMMMDGDYYPELDQARGGLTVHWDGGVQFAPYTSGAWGRKHVVGSKEDHLREAGVESQSMKTSLSTHLLRLADVYLIYAEAILGNSAWTTNAEALKAYNAVRSRSIPSHQNVTMLDFNTLFKERRLELAFEGDNWFDLVRLHYYNPDKADQYINNQERGLYGGTAANPPVNVITRKVKAPANYELPFPVADVLINPKLLEPPVRYEFPVETE